LNEIEELKQEIAMSNHINKMDHEVKDRFKAIFILKNEVWDLDEQEHKGYRDLEVNNEN
jgi:hypothetical protein